MCRTARLLQEVDSREEGVDGQIGLAGVEMERPDLHQQRRDLDGVDVGDADGICDADHLIDADDGGHLELVVEGVMPSHEGIELDFEGGGTCRSRSWIRSRNRIGYLVHIDVVVFVVIVFVKLVCVTFVVV